MNQRFFNKLGIFISIFGRALLLMFLIGAGYYASLLDVELGKKLFVLLGPVFFIGLFIHQKIWKPIKLARFGDQVPWYLIFWQYDITKSNQSKFTHKKTKIFLTLGILLFLILALNIYENIIAKDVAISNIFIIKGCLAGGIARLLYGFIIDLSRTSIGEK